MKKFYLNGHFDSFVFLLVIILWVFGAVLVYSASINDSTGELNSKFYSQLLWIGLGIITLFTTLSIPTRIYNKFSTILYAISLTLLTLILFVGVSAKGAGRWLDIGGFRIQPSEFAKIGLLLMLARHLAKNSISLYNFKTLIAPMAIIGIPFLLVLKQPDLGTAIVFITMSFPMFYWAGMSFIELYFLSSPAITFIVSAIPLVISVTSDTAIKWYWYIPTVLVIMFLFGILKLIKPPKFLVILLIVLNIGVATGTSVVWHRYVEEYQKKRVTSFINPYNDPKGSGYQVIQSIVAIGSGQFRGKGYLKGTQVNLEYLPERHTDFIFAVLGEQFGFIGTVGTLFLLLLIIIRSLRSTINIKKKFANLIIVGSTTIFTFHIFINVAMITGMTPVTGLPFPLLSYGGSFTITISILIGLILNAHADEMNHTRRRVMRDQ